MKTVSVIIPVYNTAEYLKQSVQSILEQEYEQLEIIIIDDCSKDNSYNILSEFKDKDDRIKLLTHDRRKGVGAARNLGIENATGEYIYFFDSDDYLPPETIKFLVEYIGEDNLIRGRMRNTELSTGFTIVYQGEFIPRQFVNNKFNLIKNNSACNFLFKSSFIKQNNFLFSNDNKIYSDLYFMVPILNKVNSVPYLNEALYFRRRRDNPAVNPSIRQYEEDLRIKSYLTCYIDLKRNSKTELINNYLDTELLNFYRETIITYFYEESNINEIYEILYKAVNLLNLKLLYEYDFFLKREIKTILNHGEKRYINLMKRFNFLRDLKRGLKSKNEFKSFVYKRIFVKMPIKKKMAVFESFQGRAYSDNPKYIYEYMMENHDDFKYIWCINDKSEIPGNPTVVKKLSLRYYYYLARSKYWISNSRMPNGIYKRPETLYLQTWHGTPLKKLAGDMDNVYMPGTNIVKYKENFRKETQNWDYLISPNNYSSDIFKRAFWYKEKMLEYGYPRNDVLYTKNNKRDIDFIKNRLNLPQEKKVILYAPTWRDDEYISIGNYKFSLSMDLDEMQAKLGDKYIVVLRMHYLISSNLDISKYKGFAYDLSDYDDISELYLISDVLITDYSSVFFDYANLQRPILFYMYDIEKYRDQLRGFYLELEELPGPILRETMEIVESLLELEKLNNKYKDRYKQFYNRFCQWDDGKASENVVKKLLE